MTAIKTIMNSLETFFAEQDAKVADGEVKWAFERAAAMKEFKSNPENRKMNQYSYYEKLFAVAGGKTWYNIFDGRNATMIEELVRKNSKSKNDKRNARIAAKLLKSGVTEVTDAKVAYCQDGFRGHFVVNGDKIVTVESILVGGYNIQCLHQRVLVNVK
ncbi:hypothetical protein GHT06_001855 [Daphnia sinensis]|uniref:Uncharacterized protein n=1 Tax=Daphnia sinensis TaxID=1820382 RepID=A0AAD5KTV6_9CRUS|nr:hypothetical protein GHT06_001855 [Daphnia sinensis]